jgi:hypothetical protein
VGSSAALGVDRPLDREASSPTPVSVDAPPANWAGAYAALLALQRGAGNAAVSSAIDAPAAPWSPRARAGAPALLATMRADAPLGIARAAGGRCPCGGIVPPGESECAECRRKRLAHGAARSGAPAPVGDEERRTLSRAALQRREVCEPNGACRSEPDDPARDAPPDQLPNMSIQEPAQGGSGALSRARPAAACIRPDAVYALALGPAFVSSGYSVPQGVLATEALAGQGLATGEGLAAAEGLMAAEAVPVATTAVVEGATLGESLTAAGEALLFMEAAGGAEVEAAVPVAGWIVGAVVLVAIGGLMLTGYLLSRKPPQAPAGPAGQPSAKPAPLSPELRALLDSTQPSATTVTSAPRVRPVMPAGLTAAQQALWRECADLHDTYKNTQDEIAAIELTMKPLWARLENNTATAQDRLDYCNLLEGLIRLLERLDRERRRYIDEGCDQFDWFNKGTTQAQREKDHRTELENRGRQIKNLHKVKDELCK